MFGFKSISINKIASAISTITAEAQAYFLTKLSGEGTTKNVNTTILDDSLNSYAVTNNGSVTQTSFSPFARTGSAYFSGSNSNITLPTSGIFNFGTGNFTIECWINPGRLAGYQAIAGPTYGATGGTLYLFNDTVSFYTTGNNAQTPAGSLRVGEWAHIAAVRSGTTLTIYINGVPRGSAASFTTNLTNTNGVIGTNSGGSEAYRGYISNLRVVKSDVYTSAFTTPTSPLVAVANTSLLTLQNGVLSDASAFNHVLSSTKTMSTVAFNPFGNTEITAPPPSNSILFDGSSFLQVSRDTIQFASSNFTIETWVYANSVADTAIFSRTWSGANFFMVIVSAGNMDWWVGHPNSGWGRVTTTTAPLTTGKWTHLAFTRNTNVFTIWVDGVSVASNTITVGSLNNDDATPLRIGSYPFSASSWNGNFSNFRIINGTCLYTAPFVPPTANLTAVSGTSLLIGANNTLTDLSASARALTLSGSPRVSAMSPFSTTATITSTAIPTNYSYSFNGSSYFSVSRDCVQFGTGDLTMEAWIYPTSTTEMNIFSRAWGGNNFLLCSISAGNISWWGGHAATGWFNISSTNTPIRTNQWQHVAFTRAGTAVNIWVNGASVASTTSSVNMTNTDTTPLTIGRYQFSGSPFSGNISNVRIVNGSCLYTAAFTPPSSRLIVVPGTSLLTCQGSTVVDSGPSSLAITTTGTITPQLVDYSYGNSYSVQFSGTGQYLSSPSSSALAFGTGNFTIECWINSTDVSVAQRGFLQTSTTAGGLAMSYTTGIALFQGANTSGGNLAGGLVANVCGTYIGSNTAVLSTNTWYHVAVTRQAGTVRLFLNGALNASGTAAGNCTGTNLAIGGYGSTSYLFAGRISNLRVVKGTALYTAAFTPSTSPLLLVTGTELLACQNNRLVDSSTNSLTLTATGTPAVSTTSPFTVTSTATYPASTLFAGSVLFSGTSSLQIPAASSISGTGDFTVDFWIYPTSFASGYQVLFTNDTSNGLSMSINSTGTLSFGRSLVAYDGTTSNLVNFGCWNHIAICRASGTLRIFINGLQGFSAANSTSFVSGIVRIGTDGGGSLFPYAGLMSNFRTQRAALYTNNFVPALIPVISDSVNSNTASLLEFNSYGVIDSMSQLTFTAAGTVDVSTAQKKNGNSSLFFSGAGSWLTTQQSTLLNIFTGDMTVEAWIYPTSTSLSSRTEHVAQFVLDANNSARLYFNGTTFAFSSIISNAPSDRITTTAVVTNQWNHIALVRSGGIFTLLVNGSNVGSSSTTALPIGALTLRVGTSALSSGTTNFTGYIDDFKIFTYAKYSGNFTPA